MDKGQGMSASTLHGDVFVVLVDWGTVDGYPDQAKVHAVFTDELSARRSLRRCLERSTYPAVFGKVEKHAVRSM